MACGACSGVGFSAELDGFLVEGEWVAFCFAGDAYAGGECVEDGEDADGDDYDGDAVVGVDVEGDWLGDDYRGDEVGETGDADEDAKGDHCGFDGGSNEIGCDSG